MEYNWADPKKNNKLSSLLMSKAEASRKKRLTSVRSTLSNQLHPSVENKLRRKKKAGPASARREADGADPSDAKGEQDEGDHLSDNNGSHHPSGSSRERQKAHDSRTSGKALGGYQPRSQQHQQRPESDHETSMFDAFDLNAAADGLFHPASAISAFIEHDAKYNATAVKRGKTTSGKAMQTGADSSEVRNASTKDEAVLGASPLVKELPAVSGRGPATSMRLLHTRGSSRSSSASSFASSSSVSRESTATRSDSDLLMLAPRRLGAIPSSADRSALDFYEHDEDECDSDMDHELDPRDERQSPVDGSDSSLGVKGEPFDLASKFAALKEIFHQNQAIKSSRGGEDELSSRLVEEQTSQTSASLASSSSKPLAASTGPTANFGSSKHSRVGRGQAGKSSVSSLAKVADAASSSVSAPSRMAKPSMKRVAKAGTSAAAFVSTEEGHNISPVDRKPKQKEGKTRSGMSLTDLKVEHRAALELLKELGGPTDAEFRDEAMDRSIRLLAARSGKAVGGGRGGGGRISASVKSPANAHASYKTATSTVLHHSAGATPQSSQQQLEEDGDESYSESPQRPLSSSSSGSLVSRLRSSIALGRVTSREEDTNEEGAVSDGDGVDSDEEVEGSPCAPVVESSPHESDIASLSNAINAAKDQGNTPRQAVAVGDAAELEWRQYGASFDELGVAEGEREGDSEDEERGEAVMPRGYTPESARSADNRYSDEGFEADW